MSRKGGPSPPGPCPSPHLPEFLSMFEALGLSFIPSQTFTGSQPDPMSQMRKWRPTKKSYSPNVTQLTRTVSPKANTAIPHQSP